MVVQQRAGLAAQAGREQFGTGYDVLCRVRIQRVHTLRRTRRPCKTSARFWVLTSHRRLVRRLE